MEKLDCINGLDYYKLMFRKEVCDLIRNATLSRVDYILHIDVDKQDIFTVYYKSNGATRSYTDKNNAVGKKISEFYRREKRESKLKELGI